MSGSGFFSRVDSGFFAGIGSDFFSGVGSGFLAGVGVNSTFFVGIGDGLSLRYQNSATGEVKHNSFWIEIQTPLNSGKMTKKLKFWKTNFNFFCGIYSEWFQTFS